MVNQYLQIAQKLYDLIEAAPLGPEARPVLVLAQALRPVLDEKTIPGLGLELATWAGLKLDKADFEPGYGNTIKRDYPELEHKEA